MSEITDDVLEDIFHIPKYERKDKDGQENLPSFEEKKEDLVSELGDDILKTKTLDVAVPISTGTQDIKVMIKEVVQNAHDEDEDEDEDEDIEAALGMKSTKIKTDPCPSPETEQKAHSETETETETIDVDEEYKLLVKEDKIKVEPIDYGLPKGEILWLTECPSPKFENFYNEKINVIRDISHGRQIQFTKLRDELRNSHTDISCRIFDTSILFEKMSKVQLLKQRVAQIQVDVNSQYFEWERMVELMHGVLARTQYERGKQEGIQYEHMRDMEVYFAKLKSLHKISDNIQKSLDSAVDVLSRQVTIVQDKFIRKEGNAESFVEHSNIEASVPCPVLTCIGKEVPEELAEFDDLAIGSGTTTKSPEKTDKPAKGKINQGWDNI